MTGKEFSSYLGAVALCLALGACAAKASNTQLGAVTGAVVGALAGSAMTGSLPGTIAGMAIGGVAGYEIGKRAK
jgi:hypothetical protein